MTDDIENLVLAQLRELRAENAKRDREMTLVKGDIASLKHDIHAVQSALQSVQSNIYSLLEIVRSHTDVLHALNERQVSIDKQLAELLSRH
jgi:microcompartment protein CcmL/EutN